MFKKIISAPALAIVFIAFFSSSFLYAQGSSPALQFDSTSEMQGLPPIQSRCFVKGTKIRIEITMADKSSVFLSDGQKAYLYFSEGNIAMPIAIPQVSQQLPVPQDYKDIPGLKRLGEEQINGRLCDVYEYSQKGTQHNIWVARDIDFPIRSESMTENGKVITNISNVHKNASLDDSLFQLPAGAQVVDAGSVLKGMGGGYQQ